MHEIEASLKEVKFTQEGKLSSRTLDGLKKNLKMPNKVKITSFLKLVTNVRLANYAMSVKSQLY
ncbi:hypothetical protein DR864_21750 [Runella rosea]|uniref:Uncharacterized protein n=1 Tax=Runella rosea TaxID=2259595 RepID=A0A344TNG6_9BACT|nr:hypothetical protein [Runella rosea]AXE20187.1 hypothetical protein DR864_21750 [Runella rosea]